MSDETTHVDNGTLHANNGTLHANGSRCWYDSRHRLHSFNGLPACIYADGSRFWCYEGTPHRDGDLPSSEYASGARTWCKYGKLHRDGGPAIIHADGGTEYYVDGVRSGEK